MHVVHRYQTLSVEMTARASAETAEKLETLPPVAPPVSLYANLPQEWPLARLSVHCGTLGYCSGLPSNVELLSSVFEGSTSASCRGKS